MRITQPEIESLGWKLHQSAEGRTSYFRKEDTPESKHNYFLLHVHKRDIVNIFDAKGKTQNEVTQVCNSVNDIKQLMKSQNIPYENS